MDDPVPAPGLIWPGEWAPRDGTLLAWPPAEGGTWRGSNPLIDLFDELIAQLRAVEPVYLIVGPDQASAIEKRLGGSDESLHLLPLPLNEFWLRDSAPIFALDHSGQPLAVAPRFNGWGQRFPHELDQLLPTLLSRRLGLPLHRLELCTEGGALESNGDGLILTTRSALLATNRCNPDLAVVEQRLREVFSLRRLIWLDEGLAGDHTDGHIDNLARFTRPTQLVAVSPGLPRQHPNQDRLQKNWQRLDALVADEPGLELVGLPTLDLMLQGRPVPASYANFYLAPGLVLLPTFGHNADNEARSILADLMPERRVICLDCRALINQGGGLHCLAQPLRLPSRGANQ